VERSCSKKHIFLTGAPSSGKTTVIKKIIFLLNLPCKGFYTEEERVDGKRVGFIMHTLDGEQAYLAHQDILSDYHIRRFGVDIDNIETIAVPSIKPVQGYVIILDEIGKMECFSDKFIEAAQQVLDSSSLVIGTITLGGTDFIQEVKNREDVEIIEITLENRDELPVEIVNRIRTSGSEIRSRYAPAGDAVKQKIKKHWTLTSLS
jgi:nucleoside-triphosphatase